MDEIKLAEPIKCKECGAVIDAITAAKFENCCRNCFMKKIYSKVHPF